MTMKKKIETAIKRFKEMERRREGFLENYRNTGDRIFLEIADDEQRKMDELMLAILKAKQVDKELAEAFIEKWEAVLEEEVEEDKEITEEVKELLLADGTKSAKKAHDALINIEGKVFDMGNGKMYIEKTYRIYEYVIKPIEKVTGLNRDTWDARNES